MSHIRFAFLLLVLTLSGGFSATTSATKAASKLDTTPAKQLFGAKKTGAKLRPLAIGYYTRGCLAGAVQMPITGPAWQVMRLERNRNWGHPAMIALLKKLATEAKANDGWNGLLIGDISQPRGGPMLSGHASHQMGLDADVWLTPMPNRILTRKERATMSAKLMVKDRKTIDRSRWTNAHNRLLKRAASYPQVQRIFVHPPIKKALCDWSRGQSNRSWLRKIRAYYGHNYHFHIRMRCRPGSSGCRSQAEPRPKDGTGCTTELAYWFSQKPWRRGKPRKPQPKFVNGIPLPRKKPRRRKPRLLASLPAMCKTVLTAK